MNALPHGAQRNESRAALLAWSGDVIIGFVSRSCHADGFRLAPTNEDERAASLGRCLQQAYNTTATNGIPPTHTTEVLVALESLGDQGEHR